MSTITRRRFLEATGVAAASVLASPALVRAQGKELVMLGIWPFTGAFADVGPLLDRGMKLAIEEWGNKVIGRPIKYITRDDETKASSATRRMEEAIDSENAKVVIGPCIYEPWPGLNVTIQPGRSLILTQTGKHQCTPTPTAEPPARCSEMLRHSRRRISAQASGDGRERTA